MVAAQGEGGAHFADFRELQSVGDQVAGDLAQTRGVPQPPAPDLRVHGQRETKALVDGDGAVDRVQIAGQAVHVERFGHNLQTAGLDTGDIENVIDDAHEGLARCADRGKMFPLGGGQFRPAHDVHQPQHAVERGAKLMGHRRQKFGLGEVGRLGLQSQGLGLLTANLGLSFEQFLGHGRIAEGDDRLGHQTDFVAAVRGGNRDRMVAARQPVHHPGQSHDGVGHAAAERQTHDRGAEGGEQNAERQGRAHRSHGLSLALTTRLQSPLALRLDGVQPLLSRRDQVVSGTGRADHLRGDRPRALLAGQLQGAVDRPVIPEVIGRLSLIDSRLEARIAGGETLKFGHPGFEARAVFVGDTPSVEGVAGDDVGAQ